MRCFGWRIRCNDSDRRGNASFRMCNAGKRAENRTLGRKRVVGLLVRENPQGNFVAALE